jgi:lipopolysaccharide/colanic/teichoic acid biosynthesis glycosyltransferase
VLGVLAREDSSLFDFLCVLSVSAVKSLYECSMKRLFDIVVALGALVCLFPLFLIVGVLIKLDSTGPIFFKQERIGKGFRPFWIYKFRTMRQASDGLRLTIGQDPRITRIGDFLRKTKLDEVPQLINVLKGEMSLVGPRPEVREYVELFRRDYEEILKVRPGITDIASLKYEDEATLMAQFKDPEQAYVDRILPDKIRLAKEYVSRCSFFFDLSLILKTVPRLFGFKTLKIKVEPAQQSPKERI